jgi:hypothetical protein
VSGVANWVQRGQGQSRASRWSGSLPLDGTEREDLKSGVGAGVGEKASKKIGGLVKLENWRIAELEDWRIGGLEDCRVALRYYGPLQGTKLQYQ